MKSQNHKSKISPSLQRALDDFPRIVKEQERNFKARERDIRRFDALSKQLLKLHRQKSKPKIIPPPVHLWRICPYGSHWVRSHELTIPARRSTGGPLTVIRQEHCADNPGGKDHLYPEEILQIAATHFVNLKDLPCPLNLGRPNGSDFDMIISGWTQYWNDIFVPDERLTPNMVKALISSESEFRENILANPKDANSARGLMQITNLSRRILGTVKGELKDHFLSVTRDDLNNGTINVCAGVRWLFNKRALLKRRRREWPSWLEVVGEFKGVSTASDLRANELMARFSERLLRLQQCSK